MENGPSGALTPARQHEHFTKLIGGYTAFVAALFLAVITQGSGYPRSWIVVLLLGSSLPSLVAILMLDFIIHVRQSRQKSMFRGLAAGLGFFPSLLGIEVVICHFSIVAGALFLMLIGFWLLAVLIVRDLGRHPQSDI